MRRTYALSTFLALLLVVCSLASEPPNSAAHLDSLADDVSIYRDNYGVPHIVGETEPATFFGYGYAQAEDHLEDMMVQYRDAQGRRTEVLGINALGDGYLQFIPYEYRWGGDYMQRLLRTKKSVIEHRDQIEPETYRILDGFARRLRAHCGRFRSANLLFRYIGGRFIMQGGTDRSGSNVANCSECATSCHRQHENGRVIKLLYTGRPLNN
jgi:hypothetical protein